MTRGEVGGGGQLLSCELLAAPALSVGKSHGLSGKLRATSPRLFLPSLDDFCWITVTIIANQSMC